jgi:hypothetical protein
MHRQLNLEYQFWEAPSIGTVFSIATDNKILTCTALITRLV